ncbi:MAG TPA: outer membrane protein assembly factor, partial [Rubrivivax sp.]|nr:outer membrane protein assembly factor [Rubrivivax sp.]
MLRVEVEAPRPLAALLEKHLQLARVNALAGGEPLAHEEIDRLIAATPAEAQALLDTEGYFNARIDVQHEGGTPPLVRVAVDPGPRTTVRDVRIDVDGPLAAETMRGDPYARAAQRALRHGWPLPPGAPFRGADWSDAKTDSLARLRAQGYVGADWRETEARIDAESQKADLSAAVASGPLYRMGELRIEGLRHHDAQTVRNLAAFDSGVPATEERLLDFQERLQKSDLFNRATVTLAPDPANPTATPVIVRLGERKLQDATAGLGYSANVGA